MNSQNDISKLIKKGKKIISPKNLEETILKYFSENYTEQNQREFNFIFLYYGLLDEAQTLESIGQKQTPPLTRERVRQIIDNTIKKINNLKTISENPYKKAEEIFSNLLTSDKLFLRFDEIINTKEFSSHKKNQKGLIAFFNDCGIRQIAYRKKYYFYPQELTRKEIIHLIQKENKNIRRKTTVEKMSKKAKTVTYVPNDIRTHLLNFALNNKINLNPLYEKILNEFMDKKPYLSTDFTFERTKSWKARKGKAQWQQIGIYIERDVFNRINETVKEIKKTPNKTVSLMSFICRAFIWHHEKNK